jgi:hypothetical protein
MYLKECHTYAVVKSPGPVHGRMETRGLRIAVPRSARGRRGVLWPWRMQPQCARGPEERLVPDFMKSIQCDVWQLGSLYCAMLWQRHWASGLTCQCSAGWWGRGCALACPASNSTGNAPCSGNRGTCNDGALGTGAQGSFWEIWRCCLPDP